MCSTLELELEFELEFPVMIVYFLLEDTDRGLGGGGRG